MSFSSKINYLPNTKGFSIEDKINESELSKFRKAIINQWIDKIKATSSEAYKKIQEENISIENYHVVSDYLDHAKIWTKSARILKADFVEWFLVSNFAKNLEKKYGKFIISDESNLGWPDIYWRLVRPNQIGDVGPLHRDSWFWKLNAHWCSEILKSKKSYYRLKVWIPIYTETGLNGLLVEPYSQTREDIKWSEEERHGIKKPVLINPLSEFKPELLDTKPGDAVVFNDNLIHGGAFNNGAKSRISVEFTLILKDQD